ncbi:UNVERIFIED_CONTAM: hypothetical protein RF653_10145 [Kocuria sp. CPCC 205316]|uniref:hypothetical protein n=1 Tax=Kocuria TaxID=57493 RepID=UPI0036D8F595
MTKTPKRTYTDEQKAEALEVYKQHGPGEAGRRLGIPAKTITSWAKRAGLQSDAPAATKNAVEMAQLSRAAKREELLDRMHDSALDMLDRLNAEEAVIKVTKEGVQELSYKKPQATSCKAYVEAAHILYSDIRLEAGEATSRNEDRQVVEVRDHAESLIDRFKDKKQRDELAERRKAKHG